VILGRLDSSYLLFGPIPFGDSYRFWVCLLLSLWWAVWGLKIPGGLRRHRRPEILACGGDARIMADISSMVSGSVDVLLPCTLGRLLIRDSLWGTWNVSGG